MDLSDKVSECDEVSSQTPTAERVSDPSNVKTCVDCGTSKTPLWRGGPAGPKSLCNACGIRSRKKRRALMGVNKDNKKTTKKTTAVIKHNTSQYQSNSCNSSTTSSGNSTTSTTFVNSKKKTLWSSFGRNVALQRPRSNTNRGRKLKEEEQAAFLLMSLSYGSVYA